MSGETSGYGRDQLAYNFEYSQVHYLMDDIFKYVFKNDNFVINRDYFIRFGALRWQSLLNPIRKDNFQRTFKNNNTINNYFIDVDSYTNYWINGNTYASFKSIPILPKNIYWVRLPFVKEDENDFINFINYLRQNDGVNYITQNIKIFNRNGYQLKLIKLTLH